MSLVRVEEQLISCESSWLTFPFNSCCLPVFLWYDIHYDNHKNYATMKNILLIVFTLSVQITFAQWTTTEKKQLGEKAQAILDQAISLNDFVGASAGVAQHGELLWKGGAGWSDRAGRIPAEGQMLHRTASIAKPMTAVAIMQLVEQGKIDLNLPIQTYLPEFPQKPEGVITTRHLLYHISGIKPYKNRKEGMPMDHYPTLLDAIATFQDRPLAFTPGEGYLYTTYGYVVLGAIIEKVSSKSYGDYMQEHIWSKANMPNTGLEIKGKRYTNKAKLYHKQKDKFIPVEQTDLSLKYPGGGFHSTVEDLLNFGHAMLTNQLINQETFEQMITDPGYKKRGNPYGMGWFLYGKHPKYGNVIGHSGSQAGTSTQLFILPDRGIVAATLCNTSGTWDEVFAFNQRLHELAADEEKRKQPIPQLIELSKSTLKKYEGKYQFEDGKVITIVKKDGYLCSTAKDRPDYKMYPQTESLFFMRQADAIYEFEMNTQKEVTNTTFRIGDRVYRAKKID